MEIRFFTAEKLLSWINSASFSEMPQIPISRIRAISQAHNPSAEKEDILLICTFELGVLTGYMGILPDQVFVNQEKIKVGWLSCLWVNPEFRGKGIAKKLMSAALNSYHQRIILTEFTPEAGQLYLSSGAFDPLIEMEGTRAYLKSDLSGILPQRKPYWIYLKPLLKVADLMLGFCFGHLQAFSYNRLEILGLRIESIKEIDSETEKWIASFQGEMIFRRNKTELNWILEYPWVIQKMEPDEESKPYYFTVNSRVFRQFCLKIRNESGTIIGFIVLVNRDGHLKVPYAYVDPTYNDPIMKLILHYAHLWNVCTVTIFHPGLKAELSESRFPFIYRKLVSKQFLITPELRKALNGIPFQAQAGDGDAVFT